MKIMKINNIIISLFLFHLLFIITSSNYAIIPFTTKKTNSSSFISKTSYYTLLSIGQPRKTIETYLLLNQNNFYLGKGLCQLNSFSDYIPYESETFKSYSDYEYRIGNIKDVINASDNYFLYINDLNLKQNITVKELQFYYGNSAGENEIIDKEKICGIIGFSVGYKYPQNEENYFIKMLKQKNITSSYAFSFIFFNNYTKNTIFNNNNKNDNLLIIGMNEEEISKLFKTNDLRIIQTTELYSLYDWRMTIDEIFLNDNNFIDTTTNKTLSIEKIIVTFDNEFDFIVIRIEDFNIICNSFFDKFIEKNICMINEDSSNNKYKFISCDMSFKSEMNKFPDVNFIIREINYTFTLTYKDLFIELNQKIYFMLVYESYHLYYWTLGNIFLKKYPLIFDYDKKIISFINIYNVPNNEKNFKIDYLLFLVAGICIIVGISIGVIIGKIWKKNKKKRADELVDNYEYNIKENNNEEKLYENSDIINN